ncbi:arginine--tRNA ligase [Chryseolinea sp. H1M3-3]|uniref:arginine--tRNA ligase n=1 Tax=Chryseolinea sp. H1M3-3 TaxID=3034144 RepID=UPI0023ED306B|nr:arginine--tRNA ligase [Chryseolinea sp. H1M3-3]
MNLDLVLRAKVEEAVSSLFHQQTDNLQLQPTNQEFEGSHTVVCFPLTKLSKKSPEETARILGEYLQQHAGIVSKYNVVKGFLNLVVEDKAWVDVFKSIYGNKNYGHLPANGLEIMVEYSSPNTNKPLHLGHLRNNFLGYSVAEIFKANGYKVHKVQIINDRGIHICKSMAAWKLFGNGETPETSGIKGDHLVGKYYVAFDRAYKEQIADLTDKGISQEEAEKQAPIMQMAVDMLRKWEQHDPETTQLWKTMNSWVYSGFNATYKRMGVDFEKLYYESDTYLLGKEEVLRGVERGVFFKKPDGSVWVDLTSDGLDQKVLLRADGTSVYMTQDIGTAILRFRDFPKITGQIYTVGNEQEYHFKVLFLILSKLGYDWAKKCYHLSYGMVDLPSGKMKSREGTVVDADDLMNEMVEEAEKQTRELGKLEGVSETDAVKLFDMIGLGALKFFLLKVDPKKRMLFDPNESIQLQGFTGPFIQYTHARIRAIIRKAESIDISVNVADLQLLTSLESAERDVLKVLSLFENKIRDAAKEYSPSVIANYAFDLAKQYNQFYQSIPIFNEEDTSKLKFRIALSEAVAGTLKRAMLLLGITVPEKM